MRCNELSPYPTGVMTENDKQTPPSSLTEIDARLQAARRQTVTGRDKVEHDRPENLSGIGLATRIGVEMITTTLVGSGLGYALDSWLGSQPWLMIVFIFLGGAAGVMNVYRVVKGLDDSVGLGLAVERKKQRDAQKAQNAQQD